MRVLSPNEQTREISTETIIVNTGSIEVEPSFEVNSQIAYSSEEILNLYTAVLCHNGMAGTLHAVRRAGNRKDEPRGKLMMLTRSKTWRDLEAHRQALAEKSLRELFAEDP